MLSHVILGVSDVDRAVELYDSVLGIDTFWLTRPVDGCPASVGNGTNVAFVSPSRRAVRDFYKKALSLGGTKTSEGLESRSP